MKPPLADEQLAEIRQRCGPVPTDREWTGFNDDDVTWLLARIPALLATVEHWKARAEEGDLTLNDQDRDRLMALLDEPHGPVSALLRAGKRHQDMVGEEGD